MTGPFPFWLKLLFQAGKQLTETLALALAAWWAQWEPHMDVAAHVKLAEVFLHDACETKAIKNSKTLCQPSLSTLLLPAVSFLWTKKPGSLQGFGHSHKPRIGRQAAAEDQVTSSCTYKLQAVSLSVFSLGCQTMIIPCNWSYRSATIKINLNLITAV